MPIEEAVAELHRLGEDIDENVDPRLRVYQLRTTVNWSQWGDFGPVESKSVLAMTRNPTYDDYIMETNDSYFQKTQRNIDIQKIVEKPRLYVLARCSSQTTDLLDLAPVLRDDLNAAPLAPYLCETYFT